MRGEEGEAACPREGDVDHGRHLGVLQRRAQPEVPEEVEPRGLLRGGAHRGEADPQEEQLRRGDHEAHGAGERVEARQVPPGWVQGGVRFGLGLGLA